MQSTIAISAPVPSAMPNFNCDTWVASGVTPKQTWRAGWTKAVSKLDCLRYPPGVLLPELADLPYVIEAKPPWTHNRQRQKGAEVEHNRFSVVRFSPEELEVVHEAPGDKDINKNQQSGPARP